MINVAILGLKAVGICNTANSEKQSMYNRRLPKVSDNGARIKGPMPRKTTKPVVAPITVSGEVCKSSAIWLVPGTNMELANGLMIAISEMIATLVNFLNLDQFLGFSGSFSENSISCSNHQSKEIQMLTNDTSDYESLKKKKWQILPLAPHWCVHSVLEQNAHPSHLPCLPFSQLSIKEQGTADFPAATAVTMRFG